jgi:hypothetical protein
MLGKHEPKNICFCPGVGDPFWNSVSAQSNKIHISAPSKSLSWFPIHLTREKGFYRAEGLDVDYVIMKPQIAMQALIAGDVGYTTALGSTIRAALRNVPLRVVMTIADKPLFALIARPSINSGGRIARKTDRYFILRRQHRHLRPRAAAPL